MAMCELEDISRIEEEMNQLEDMRIREEMKMEGAVKETPVDINVFGLYGHFNILTIIVVMVAIGLGLQGRWMMTGNDLLLDHLAEMSHSSNIPDQVVPFTPRLSRSTDLKNRSCPGDDRYLSVKMATLVVLRYF